MKAKSSDSRCRDLEGPWRSAELFALRGIRPQMLGLMPAGAALPVPHRARRGATDVEAAVAE
eukprot:CAMPEP_0175249788 /NCGR_PEP_ID=MMETSP0093-20121207/34821_1 /TAXON_ID=311494 /ORGANISM="Alexandrium monilatum, Strain CCMP3105" /LENGTH=61 /DNA_ID=CAMNT_0016544019 /DNA_START=1 /DNA_END=184 /DNA_ORIENTATION=+